MVANVWFAYDELVASSVVVYLVRVAGWQGGRVAGWHTANTRLAVLPLHRKHQIGCFASAPLSIPCFRTPSVNVEVNAIRFS